MKLVIFSDPHIGEYKAYNTTSNQRLNDTCEVLYQMFSKADTLDNIVLCCGDLIDKAAGVSTLVLNKLFSMFEHCWRDFPDVKFYCISGNHDMVNRFTIEENDSILNVLHQHFSNFYHLAGVTQLRHLEEIVKLAGVPFFDKREMFLSYLASLGQPTGTTILLTHQSDPETPFADIFSDDVKGFDWCFNGHIHRYKEHTPRFFTVGNPLHRNLSDVGDKKGYLVLDTKESIVTREFLNFQEFSLANTKMVEAPTQKVKEGFVSHLNTQEGKDPLYDGYCKLQNLPLLTIDVGKNCI